MSRILLIESDPATAERHSALVRATPGFTLAGVAHTLAQGRAAAAAHPCDLVVGDVRLVDGMFATLVAEMAARRHDRPQTLAIVAAVHDPHLMHVMRSGADGYFVAGRSTEALVRTARQILAGESPMAPEIARRVLEHFEGLDQQAQTSKLPRNALHLSDIERQLLQWINEGYLMQEIALGLRITVSQVGLRVRMLYRKLQFDVRADSLSLRAA